MVLGFLMSNVTPVVPRCKAIDLAFTSGMNFVVAVLRCEIGVPWSVN